MATKTQIKWTWQDDFRAELATKQPSDLYTMLNDYEGQRCPSERTLDATLIIRHEIHIREEANAKSLGLA